jgi:hypothetical protein
MLDLGDCMTKFQLANVMHEAAYRRKMSSEKLEAMLRRSNGRHGISTVAAALELHRSGSAGTRSALEDQFLAEFFTAGGAEPRVNCRVPTMGGSIEVDFWWPEVGVCVEIDGSGHDRRATQLDDEARDAWLASVGIEVIRVRPHEIPRAARELARRLPWGGVT